MTKTIQHTAFVNLYNKNSNIFQTLFKDTRTLAQLTSKIIKISKSYESLAYKDADKVKGDLFEIFAECFFEIMGAHPGILIGGYQPAPPIDDYGVDGFGIGMDNKPATIQVKFRSNVTSELIEEDIKQFPLQSIFNYNVDKDTRTNMIVFTNAKSMHWITESRVFSGRVRTLGNKEISGLIDNNFIFWNKILDMVQETIKEKYN